MTEFVTTSFGDRIAYDRRGSGPALIFVVGAGQHRASDPITTETAELAAEQGISTFVFDRLGRGESQASGALSLDRELAALAALIEVAGGSAVLCGHSSGCAISLKAAVDGLPVRGLALWEAPITPAKAGLSEWAAEIERRMDAGELEGALEYFMKDMPPEWLAGARQSPMFPAMVAGVVSYRADAQALAWTESMPHSELFSGIRVPTVAMMGEQTLDEMIASSIDIERSVPGATQQRMPGAHHSWEAAPMAAELVRFTRTAFNE